MVFFSGEHFRILVVKQRLCVIWKSPLPSFLFWLLLLALCSLSSVISRRSLVSYTLYIYPFLKATHTNVLFLYISIQFSSVAQLCPTLCDPMDCSTPGLPVHHQLQSLLKLIVSVMPSNHVNLCRRTCRTPNVMPKPFLLL